MGCHSSHQVAAQGASAASRCLPGGAYSKEPSLPVGNSVCSRISSRSSPAIFLPEVNLDAVHPALRGSLASILYALQGLSNSRSSPNIATANANANALVGATPEGLKKQLSGKDISLVAAANASPRNEQQFFAHWRRILEALGPKPNALLGLCSLVELLRQDNRLEVGHTEVVMLEKLLDSLRWRQDGPHATRIRLLPVEDIRSAEFLLTQECLAALLDAMGEVKLALLLLRRSYQDCLAKLSDDDFDGRSLVASLNLAQVLMSCERYAEAEPVLRAAMEARESTWMAGNQDNLELLRIFASCLLRTGRPGEAEALATRAVEQAERALGAHHPLTMAAATALADHLEASGKLGESESYNWQILEAREVALGPGHEQSLSSLKTMAVQLQCSGCLAERDTLLRHALKNKNLPLTSNVPDLSTYLDSVTTLLQALGKGEGSWIGSRRYLDHPEASLGPLFASSPVALVHNAAQFSFPRECANPVTRFRAATLGCGLAATIHALTVGTVSEWPGLVEELLVTALGGRGGPVQPHNVPEALDLAFFLFLEQKYEDAERLLTQVYDLKETLLGPQHPETLMAVHNLALAMIASGKKAGATVLLRNNLQVREEVLGLTHKETLSSLSTLALLEGVMSRHEQAEELLSMLFERSIEALGPTHPRTLITAHNLAALQFALGRVEAAEAALRRVAEACEAELPSGQSQESPAAAGFGGGGSSPSLPQSHSDFGGGSPSPSPLPSPSAASAAADSPRSRPQSRPQTPGGKSSASLNSPKHPFGKLGSSISAMSSPCSEAQFLTKHPQGPSLLRVLELRAALLDAMRRWPESVSLLQQVVTGRERLLGTNHPDTLVAVDNLCSMMDKMGQLQDAIPLSLRSLEGRQSTLGSEHLESLLATYRHALVLRSLGRHHEAIALLPRVVSIREAALGPEDPETLLALHALATLLQATGHLDKAEAHWKRVFQVFSKRLGKRHPDTLRAGRSQAEILLAMGQFKAARDAYETVLKASELGHLTLLSPRSKVPMSPSATTAASSDMPIGVAHDLLQGLADTLCRQGHFDEAESLCSQAARGRVQALGMADSETMASLCSLASILVAVGRPEEAERLFLRALAASGDPSWGEACPALLPALGHVSTAELAKMLKNARQMKVSVLEPKPEEDSASFSLGLATILEASGNLAEAEPLLRSALEDREKMLGATHLDTLAATRRLGVLLSRLCNHGDAEHLLRQALTSLERRRGGEDPLSLECSIALGRALEAAGLARESEQILRHAVDVAQAALGPGHPTTASALSSLAALLESHDKESSTREAERLLRRAVEAFQQSRGLQHSHTMKATKALATLLRKQGKEQEAWHLYRVALAGAPPIPAEAPPEVGPVPDYVGTCWPSLSEVGICCSRRSAANDAHSINLPRQPGLRKEPTFALEFAK